MSSFPVTATSIDFNSAQLEDRKKLVTSFYALPLTFEKQTLERVLRGC